MVTPSYSGEKKEFSANVPAEEYQYFRLAFPQYGAVTWFITEALRHFNEHLAANPSIRHSISISITRMVDENREESAE